MLDSTLALDGSQWHLVFNSISFVRCPVILQVLAHDEQTFLGWKYEMYKVHLHIKVNCPEFE